MLTTSNRSVSFTIVAAVAAKWAALGLLGAAMAGCSGNLAMPFKYEDPQAAGLKQYQAQDYGNAAGSFQHAIGRDPRDYQSIYYLGMTYDAMGRHEEAVESYKASLDVMKISFAGQDDLEFRLKVMNALANTIARNDAHDVQVDALDAKARTSRNAWDYFQLAKVFRARGDADSAMEAYGHAVLLDNKCLPILKDYGLYLEQLGQTAKARMVMCQAGAVDSTDPEVAAALRRMGVVPGPSLKDASELAGPPVPEGPIPTFDKITDGIGRGLGLKNSNAPARPAPKSPAASVQAPRD